MLVLFETPAGYAIFKLLDSKKLKHIDNLYRDFETPEAANKVIKLKHFEKFADTTEALAATTAAVDGKLSKLLKKTLKKLVIDDVQEELLVADSKLGFSIKEKLNLQCVSNDSVQELMRCIRSQCDSLISGLSQKDLTSMSLGLAHSLSRYKLKFSSDKIDTMIAQCVPLLENFDKELNNYIMRCREWYGWHFPELGKIITDNITYINTIKIIGTRDNAASADLSQVLAEHLEDQVKEAAEVSMGTEIIEEDINIILGWCDQVLKLHEYRSTLKEYIISRMFAMAPNVATLVDSLVGARLIAHAGSLLNLAKNPASTIQILGAEKALFRALKTKKDTPKYGLIYHASLITQTSNTNKGKAARMLAAKVALASRFDALVEDSASPDLGAEHKAKLEARIRILEEGNLKRISGTGKAKAKFEKYHGVSEIKQYPSAADSTIPSLKRKRPDLDDSVAIKSEPEDAPVHKKKKVKKTQETSDTADNEEVKIEVDQTTPKQKKKKKKASQDETESQEVKQEAEVEDVETSSKKKKKKKSKQNE